MIDIERLRAEMEQQDLSQAALAAAVNATPSAIQQILNGKTKQTRLTSGIAKALGVSVEWLEGHADSKDRFKVVFRDQEDSESVLVPYFIDGISIDSAGSIDQRFTVFSKHWVEAAFLADQGAKDIILVKIKSPQMIPSILPGDDIAIKNVRKYDENPDTIWIFQYRNTIYLRRIRRNHDGMLSCVADNPSYPPFSVREEEIIIRGRVVWQGRTLHT